MRLILNTLMPNTVLNEKKVIVIFGGSGQLGELLFDAYDQEKYTVINISLHKKLHTRGVINIRADITKKLGLLYTSFRLRTLVTKVDVLILSSMFIYHKDLFSLTKKELAYEFDVNVFSQIECIKMIMDTFWTTATKDVRSCFYISSASSLLVTKRQDLESYTVEKQSLNFISRYLKQALSKLQVNSLLYLPGSLTEKQVSSALCSHFWKDVVETTNDNTKERIFI